MKLDILGQKMIAFDRSRSRGAYVRDTLHINPFETSWQIPGPCAWSIRKINKPSKKDDGMLYGQENEFPHLMRISIISVS